MRVHGGAAPIEVTADEAAALVTDGARLGIESSGGGVLEPSALIDALARRYDRTVSPASITVLTCSGVGDRKGSGLDRLTAPGLLRRSVVGHYGMSPRLAEMADAGDLEAYNLPQGVLAQLLRETAAGRPGLVTHVGIDTFVDPRHGGGRLNASTTEDIVEVVDLGGREWLFYPSTPIDVAFIRATTADEAGNLSIEAEPARLSIESMAAAARSSGGTVIAQVARRVPRGSIRAMDVVVPGHLVDYIVHEPDAWQTAARQYASGLTGNGSAEPAPSHPPERPERAIVGRRALAELQPGAVVNLGVGMPDAVATLAAIDGRLEDFTLTVEQGLVGGMPAGGVEFGAVWNAEAMMPQHVQFDFYDGGGLDVACLGFAEVDRHGNVNVSRIDGRIFGVGGFINISQNAKRLVFCGSFTSGGLDVACSEGRLTIRREGRHRKFHEVVHERTFSAGRARSRAQDVMYVTERAVFELRDTVTLTEIAPGIDLERDVLAHMAFRPTIAEDLKPMDGALFT